MPLAVEAKNVKHWISKGSLYVFKIGREDTQAELHKDDHTKTEAMAGVKPLQAEECQRLRAIRRARRKQQEVRPPTPPPAKTSEKAGPYQHLDFRVLPPELYENKFLFFQFIQVCGNLFQQP